MFVDQLKKALNDEFNVSRTENGALGYRTTGKDLLDLNFAVSSLRKAPDEKIEKMFAKAYFADKIAAMRWLFYARDIRGGLGERRMFRTVMRWLIAYDRPVAVAVIPLIAEYGRWDDMIDLLNVNDEVTRLQILDIIGSQIKADLSSYHSGKNVSLLAKWMPSINTSSQKSVEMARNIAKSMGVSEKVYRKSLSALRKTIGIVETSMSQNEWSGINYGSVPSRANLVYNGAFLRHDEERRRQFLSKAVKGEVKMNSATLYPHDIVHKYGRSRLVDNGLEAMWKNLPDYVNGAKNTIVVADGSASMVSNKVGNTSIEALQVANAIALYFADRLSGEFANKYITFSTRPQLVTVNQATLRDRIMCALAHNEVADTNIEAVFDLILTTAINGKMKQEEIPENILVISDMEFNRCVVGNNERPSERLFTIIAKRYEDAGYKLPRVVFWNVNSRTGTIPVINNEMGVALVSGFTPAIAKMVLSNQTDPYECLLATIRDKRYDAIEDVVTKVLE